MNKKIILLLIIGGLITVLTFLIIFFLPGEKPPFEIKMSEISVLIDEKVLFPALDSTEENVVYFNPEEKSFFQYSLKTGEKKKISQAIDELSIRAWSAAWSPNRDKAILIAYDLENWEILNWHYDFNTGALIRLNLDTEKVVWSPDGKRILYHFYDPETYTNQIRWANPDGTNAQKIKTIEGGEDIQFGFLSLEEIYYHFRPTEGETGSNIYKINLKTRWLDEIVGDETAVGVLASPDGNYLAYIIFHKDKFIELERNRQEKKKSWDEEEAKKVYTLGLISIDGKIKKDFGLLVDNIEKVVFSPDGKLLVSAVSEKDRDKFYKIEIDSGKISEIPYSFGEPIFVRNLTLTKDGKTLYFASDDNLYKLEIKI